MRTLTRDTKIAVKAPRRELTGETKIKLGQIKDLAAWVEDRRYKVGQISEKTGLQKQTDGSWKEPKGKQKSRSLKSETRENNGDQAKELNDKQKDQTKAIEKRINKNGWFKNPSSLDGMHPEAAENIEKQCKMIFLGFPDLKCFIEGIKTEIFPDDENKAFAKCEGTGDSAYIVFNKQFFSNNKMLHDTYQKTVDEGYHPAGTTADSIVVHELSHCLCDYIAQKRGQDFDSFNREVIKYTVGEFENAGIQLNIKKELGSYGLDQKACPTTEIKNAEIIAEAFTEYKCSKTPRRLAMFIGNLIEGEFE